MGRWHSIAARKAAGDAKKSSNYAKIGKIIQIAAKKGADPKMNPSLDLALSKARQFGLPKEVVEKAILKGSGQLEGENLEEVFYEGYGPGGIAILIKTLTSNTNRTSANIKQIMGKQGGTMGTQGSVSRQFQEKGIFVTDGKVEKIEDKGKTLDKIHPLVISEFEDYIIELPILDFEVDGPAIVIYTQKTNFSEVQKKLEADHYHLIQADIQYVPENTIKLGEEEKNKFLTLIEALENDDDVDAVWHNAEEN